MKTRPHIVTQTCEYDTAAMYSNADLLAARMGTAGSLKTILGYSRVLIRIMKIILDLTLHNDCFVRRRDVLGSPRLRKLVTERLGGAHGLLKWRRQNTWNKARLAAIASGEYRPMPMPHIPLTAQRPRPGRVHAAVAKHTAGIKRLADKFLTGAAKGIDAIACTSVNDVFVMGAWAKDQGVSNEMVLLADGNGDFAQDIGLSLDATGFGMGKRSQRYCMVVNDGTVEHLFIDDGGDFKVSSADYLLEQL